MDSVIYTIGHSNQTMDEFLALLERQSITLVVDIRSAPYSSYVYHFSREILDKVIHKHGLTYIYRGDILGGKPRNISNSISNSGQFDYTMIQKQDSFKQGLDELIELSKTHKLALMCAEEDPDNCHREELVSSALRLKQVKIIHIRKSGLDRGNTSLDQYF